MNCSRQAGLAIVNCFMRLFGHLARLVCSLRLEARKTCKTWYGDLAGLIWTLVLTPLFWCNDLTLSAKLVAEVSAAG